MYCLRIQYSYSDRRRNKMVTIEIHDNEITLNVLGFHRIWAFKKKVTFKKSNIVNIRIAEKTLRPAPVRFPGTYVPGYFAAGTYLGKGRKEFWDAIFKKDAIEIDLKNEIYSKLVVNVQNAIDSIDKLK